MEVAEMKAALSGVEDGDVEIRITFKPGTGRKQRLSDEAYMIILWLIRAYRERWLRFPESNCMIMHCIVMSQEFDNDHCRTFEIIVPKGFDIKFLDPMLLVLESVERLPSGSIVITEPHTFKPKPLPQTFLQVCGNLVVDVMAVLGIVVLIWLAFDFFRGWF